MSERQFGKLFRGFFTDDDMRALPLDARFVAAGLIVMSPNYIGCWQVKAAQIQQFVGLPDDAPLLSGGSKRERDYDDDDATAIDRVKDCLRVLDKARFLRRDRRSGWLWIRRFATYNGSAGYVWSNLQALATVPRDLPYFDELIETLRQDIAPTARRMIDAFEDAASRDKKRVARALEVARSATEAATEARRGDVSTDRTRNVSRSTTRNVSNKRTRNVSAATTRNVSDHTTGDVSDRTTGNVSAATTRNVDSKTQEKDSSLSAESESIATESRLGRRARESTATASNGHERNSVTTEAEDRALRDDRKPRPRAGANPHGMVVERYFQIFELQRTSIFGGPNRVDPPRSQKDKIAAVSWAEKGLTPATFETMCEIVIGDMHEKKPRDPPNSIRVVQHLVDEWNADRVTPRGNGTRSNRNGVDVDEGYQPPKEWPFTTWVDTGRAFLRSSKTWRRDHIGPWPGEPGSRIPDDAWKCAQQLGPLARGQTTTAAEIESTGRKIS